MKAWYSWVAAAGAVVLLLFGVNYCRDRQREAHGAAKQAVADQQAVVAKQDSIVIRDTVWLARADTALSRRLAKWKVRVDTVPDTVLVATASDVDSLVRSCEDYRNTCRQTTADFLQLRLDHLELERRYKALVATPRPRRRWGLGCAGGYGAVVNQGTVRVGPGASCGLAFSF